MLTSEAESIAPTVTVVTQRRRARVDVAKLLLMSLALAIARLAFIHDFPEWDRATYTLIGREITLGRHLYSDIWDMKPPAIFASYAAALWIVTSQTLASYLLATTTSIITLVAIYFAAIAIDRRAGLWAGLCWVAVCVQPALGADFANTEAFINVSIATVAALIFWNDERHWRRVPTYAISVGFLYAIATLFKQVAIAPAITLCIAVLIRDFVARRPLRRALIETTTIFGTIAAAWLFTALYFRLTNRGDIFYLTSFVYPRFYAGNPIRNCLAAFRFANLFPHAMREAWPIVFLAGAGALGAIRSRTSIQLIALAIGCFVATALPGQFLDHYYQLWLVPVALLGGLGASKLTAAKSRVITLLPFLAIAGTIALSSHWWLLSPRERAAQEHPASTFLNVVDAAERLKARLLDNHDTFYAWSDEPQIYLLLNRRPPAAGLWKMHTIDGPMADVLTERTLRDLRSAPPGFILTGGGASNEQPINLWIHSNYPIEDASTYFPFVLHTRAPSRDLSQ